VFPLDDDEGMLPAVEPSPVEPMTLLVVAVVDAVEVEEVLADDPVAALSEKRLVEPRVAPRLLAGELAAAAPEVSAEEDVLVVVLVETMATVEATIEVVLAGFEAFEVEFREDTRFPLPLPRSPFNRGAIRAANRSAWTAPPSRTVRRSSPTETIAVRTATADGPPPPLSGAGRV
jgi:hypothetical protein